MQSKGQECVHQFTESFSKMCIMKRTGLGFFYILKMLYLVCMFLCTNLKHVQVKLFKAAEKNTNIAGEEKTDLTK